ncbi:MAG: hypothetical protein KBT01_05755 [Clostridiales bacterium]|nr:hypothetical protein [Candidatus Blautia equi]
MKMPKYLVPLFLILCVLFCSACGSNKSQVESAVKEELNVLKHLDTEASEKYISYAGLFPDAAEDSVNMDEIHQVFSLFFKKFNYRIRKTEIDSKANEATVKLTLKTLDAHALAVDYARAFLRESILLEASSDTSGSTLPSLESRYHLLYQLLSNNKYKTVDTDCQVQLTREGPKADWQIRHNTALENDLTGGLITEISEPELLTPAETLSISFDLLEDMNLEQMSSFLGLDDLLNSEDPGQQKIARTLIEKAHVTFKYQLGECRMTEAGHAEVDAVITTFDSDAVLSEYQAAFEEYLTTSQAVVDGSDVRSAKAYDMLTEYIDASETIIDRNITLKMVNNGVSWQLDPSDPALANALFGTLTEPAAAE